MKNKDSNLIITGLAGTGKSWKIDKIVSNKVENNEIQTNEICSLTFDKALSAKYKNDFAWSNKSNSFTIHGFCYHVLSELLMLPEGFRNNSNGDIEEGPTGRDFNKLISLFLKLSNHKIKRTKFYHHYISKIKIITCDEAQDFREDYIEVVKKIKALSNEAQLIVAGDRHQQIYIFQNRNNSSKLSDVLNDSKLIFGDEPYKKIVLTVNHRTENTYNINFMNGFLKKNSDISKEELYTNLPEFFNNKEIKQSRKMPLIKLFTNREEEEDFVKAKISGIDNKKNKIVIIARNNKTLKMYSDLNNRNNITVSTVHKVKGNEFDYVFYVGFEYNVKTDNEIKTICYTAISRAKKKLFITSSFPNKNIFEVFEKGSFIYRNVQKYICKPFPVRKKIKKNRNFTEKKLRENYLDSLVLKIKADRCPFLTHINKEGTKQKKWSSSQRVVNKDGFEYSIDFHHSQRIYFFNFLDLNLLKRNNFSDTEIIEYCANEIIEFFDRRVNLDGIEVHRLDLYYLLKLEDKDNYKRIYEEVLFDKVLDSKHRSILNQNRDSFNNKDDFKIKRFSIKRDTIYNNHHKKKQESLTTVIYNPRYKENGNKIHIDNLIKFEMKGKGNFLKRKIGFNDYEPTVLNLINISENEGLDSILENWIKYYYGDLDEIYPFLIENQ